MIELIATSFMQVCLLAHAAVSADLAYEKVAQRLELVRNQVELTIANQGSLKHDVKRQERELEMFGVYHRIPLARDDFKSDKPFFEQLRGDFAKAQEARPGFELKSARFLGGWKSAPKKVPPSLPFDHNQRIGEDQVADSRPIELVIAFNDQLPVDPKAWLVEQSAQVRRLIDATRFDRKGKQLIVRGKIYRYREFDYPQMVAPDLAKYGVPGTPSSPVQKAATQRISRYREDIMRLWPKAQPYLSDVRTFAMNDLRMNFFLKRANVPQNRHSHGGH